MTDGRFRAVLSIAGISMAVESKREFRLTDRCLPFLTACEKPDVSFFLLPTAEFDSSGIEILHRDGHRMACRRGQERFYICTDRQHRDRLRWVTRWHTETPGRLEVHIFAADLWENLNPLTFVELSEFLIGQNVMILHAALISCGGQGILFTAPSGTGKSTQAELWERFRGAQILNGDRAMIRKQDGYRAYGSPYSGSSGIYRRESVPVSAVVVLRQARENRIRRLGAREAYLAMLSEMSVSPVSRETVERQTQWLAEMIGKVRVYGLDCRPDEGAVETLWHQWKEDQYGTEGTGALRIPD